MKRSARMLAKVLVPVGIVAGVIAAPAAAHAAEKDCPLGYVCTWEDANFVTAEAGPTWSGKSMVRFQYYIPNYSGLFYAYSNVGATNSATSIKNNGRFDTAYLYANPNKRTKLFELPVGNSNWSLWGAHGDNIESGYFRTYN